MNDVQILLYTSYLHVVGGIETFVINFIDLLKDEYSIGLYCPKIDGKIESMLTKRVKVFRDNKPISCDTLVVIRVMEDVPQNVTFNKSIRMVHACKSNPKWFIADGCDKVVHVSEVSKQTFKSDGLVIHNPLLKDDRKALIIVSATRIPALDKGQNAQRMLKLAEMLNKADIPFMWLNFSDAPLKNAPKGFMNVGSYHELQPYIAKADYLVQLSDQEGFGYSVLEALVSGTAVICTPFGTAKELGVVDGINGYVVPFNLDFDVKKLLNVPKFTFNWDNSEIKSKWKKLFGKPAKMQKYVPEKMVTLKILRDVKDSITKEQLFKGDVIERTEKRAEDFIKLNFAEKLR